MLSLSLAGLVLAAVLTAGYLLYRAAIPTPIPGIPFVRLSATRPFGDFPALVKHNAKTKEFTSFLVNKCVELNSPVIQVFIRPFQRPWVVLQDSREAQDVLARRTREFDRSEAFIDMFVGTIPHSMTVTRTNDQWRSNRRLMADTMSPQFLHGVAAPRERATFNSILDLWKIKADLAQGHAFEATQDLDQLMVDNITGIAFGTSTGVIDAQVKLLKSLSKLLEPPTGLAKPVLFPSAPHPEIYDALTKVAWSSEIGLKSPFGRYHHAFALKYYPKLRKAVQIRDAFITERLQAAWKKFNDAEASEDDVKSACDLIVAKEVFLAKKHGRAPEYDSPVVRDELFGFLLAGFDTTAGTIKWGLKYLTKHQDVQRKLRDSLRSTFKQAKADGELPKAEDMATLRTPYLDAVLEEILRLGITAQGNVRVATQDVELLGYHIPKGTDVVTPNSGPSLSAPPMYVDESKRSKTSQAVAPEDRWTGDWDQTTLGEFRPERWLRKNAQGEMDFDSRAGPMQTFGGGLRGCFGRKLAMLSLRIFFTMLIWIFELQPVPDELDSWAAEDLMTHQPQQTYVQLKACAT
ncbi:hypothetical protein LTR97_001177 [Elasticomyces elasticus]|uniref:Cytochrome P450 n=1 Tax=Elasticomyces elasticus TaxID=574655 RepID=A0AAN8A4V6_9PEZI|nr:hypothetical protein LTR97_001177 [Elasticomyces elasticus]